MIIMHNQLVKKSQELNDFNNRFCKQLQKEATRTADLLKKCQSTPQAEKKAEEINETTFQQYLTTKSVPDPELLIRTSGEYRISNFLLWQIAYSELYFTDTLWPDFRRTDLYKAILNYQNRERRFGKTSKQLCQKPFWWNEKKTFSG